MPKVSEESAKALRSFKLEDHIEVAAALLPVFVEGVDFVSIPRRALDRRDNVLTYDLEVEFDVDLDKFETLTDEQVFNAFDRNQIRAQADLADKESNCLLSQLLHAEIKKFSIDDFKTLAHKKNKALITSAPTYRKFRHFDENCRRELLKTGVVGYIGQTPIYVPHLAKGTLGNSVGFISDGVVNVSDGIKIDVSMNNKIVKYKFKERIGLKLEDVTVCDIEGLDDVPEGN